MNFFPTSLTTTNNWTKPTNATWTPTNLAPIFTVTNQSFGNIIGFNVGDYGGTAISSSAIRN
jgi:hypothetical protein